jgi:hypothetical protein
MRIVVVAHEAAKRYCDAVLIRDRVVALLESLNVPASAREPMHMDTLTASWRR